MNVKYGFYNAQNGLPKYDATDFSKLFDGLITAGVFAGYGDAFAVTAATTGLRVLVGTGRAWFNNTWTLNESAQYIDIDRGTSGFKRIDTVVIQVDKANRKNDIIVVKGDPKTSNLTPTPKELTKGANNVWQYPIAYITINDKPSVLSDNDIIDCRGKASEGTPYVTGVVQSIGVDTYLKQFENSFNTWFNGIKNTLGSTSVGKLTELDETVNSAFMHRNTVRHTLSGGVYTVGRNLGPLDILQDYLQGIIMGSFDDIYVGDYWTDDTGNYWRVVDIDYWYRGTGSGASGNHHILVMPDSPIAKGTAYGSTASTAAGFVDSDIGQMTVYLSSGAMPTKMSSFISTHIPQGIIDNRLDIREWLIDETNSNGTPNSGTWYKSLCSVPSEIMMYGTRIWSPGNINASSTTKLSTNSPTQLALFRLCPSLIFSDTNYWLKDAVSATSYAYVLAGNGSANQALATYSGCGLRPIFAIG